MVGGASECELCQLSKFTAWYFEDDLCVVLECESCGVPMVVLREHRTELTSAEEAHLRGSLEEAATGFFAGQAFYIDGLRRQIPDHYHAHAPRRHFGWPR